MVDTLCAMVKNFCITDTIDDSVTGSFQQIDLNRHLEKIVESVEKILIKQLNSLILNHDNINSFCNLLNIWENYTKLLKLNDGALDTHILMLRDSFYILFFLISQMKQQKQHQPN